MCLTRLCPVTEEGTADLNLVNTILKRIQSGILSSQHQMLGPTSNAFLRQIASSSAGVPLFHQPIGVVMLASNGRIRAVEIFVIHKAAFQLILNENDQFTFVDVCTSIDDECN